VLSCPSGMSVSSRALNLLADALRRRRNQLATRWRKLSVGRQALLVLAYLREGETELACGFEVGTSTVYRYVREAIELLAAMAPTLEQVIEVARRKAFVILDGSLLRIDRVGMNSGYDRGFYSGKHKALGVNVQVIADPAGRLVWISSTLSGARHDLAAAREHGIIDALADAGVAAVADTACQGAGPSVAVPQRRRRLDPDTDATGPCRAPTQTRSGDRPAQDPLLSGIRPRRRSRGGLGRRSTRSERSRRTNSTGRSARTSASRVMS
jgi:hypothetical protein